MTPKTWEAMAAEFDALAADRGQAEALVAQLARAIFPDGADIDRLTWRDDASPTASGAAPVDGRALAEERMRAAEKRFRTLVEQIPAVTFMAVLGEGKNEVYVSPHIEQMLGYTQDEWLRDPFLWYWRLHPDDRTMWNEEFARGCRSGGPFRAECRFLARDGHTVWVHGEARVVKDDQGRPQFLQGVAFDITEAKRAQEILLTAAVHRARTDEELAIARRVQTSIVPQTFDVAGLEIAAAMVPASEVGGDYYEALPFPGGGWLAIGDVSGHGLNAGLVMLMVQTATVAITSLDAAARPRDLLCRLNEVIFDNVRSRLGQKDHVTFTLMRYTRDGRIVMSGAHEDILVWRRRTRHVELFRPQGPWLGARRDITRVAVDTTLVLEDGDLMVLYTDGITEAMNAAGVQFNVERLCQTVERSATEPPAVVRDHVLAAVRAWMKEQVDDMSIVVLRYAAPKQV